MKNLLRWTSALSLVIGLAMALGCGIDTTEILAPPGPDLPGNNGNGDPGGTPTYAADIEPLLLNFCSACHNDSSLTGGMSVDSYASLFPPTSSADFVIAGDSAGSRMVVRLDAGTMPPPGNPAPTQAQIDAIRAWIDAGALNN